MLGPSSCASAPVGGSEGPKSSSSLLLSPSCGCVVAGSVGRSSRGAGGIAGPITLLRLSAPSGLDDRFAPEAMGDSSWACSSCCRFRLARRCGGSSAPMPDMIIYIEWCGKGSVAGGL